MHRVVQKELALENKSIYVVYVRDSTTPKLVQSINTLIPCVVCVYVNCANFEIKGK